MKQQVCLLLSSVSLLAVDLQAFEASGIDIHGSVLTTLSYSDEYNYLGETAEKVSLNDTEVTINGQYRFENGLRLGAQIYAYDIGEVDQVTLDWAVADYSFSQALGVRAGRMKYQLGLYNNIRDVDAAHTFAVLPNAVYPKYLRAYASSLDGAMLYGNISAGAAGSFDYEVSYGTRQVYKDEAGILANFGADEAEADDIYGFGLIWNTPIDGLRGAYTYHHMDPLTLNSSFFDPMSGSVVYWDSKMEMTYHIFSVEYLWNSWRFVAEYQRNPMELNIFGEFVKLLGESYYFLAAYRVNDWLELGAYYNVDYPNKDDKDGDSYAAGYPERGVGPTPRHQAWTKELALAARFDITANWLIKAEVHFMDGTSRLSTASMGVPNASVDQWSAKWTYLVLRTTFTF